MESIKERNFHEKKDSGFKVTLILNRWKYLNTFLLFVFNIGIKAFRTFQGKHNNTTGKLLIICLHRLGDTVFCIPTIEGIFECFKNYDITILSYPETKSILKLKFSEDRIISIDKNDFILKRRLAKRSLRRSVKKLKPEIIFDLTGDPASASLVLNSAAKKIIGTNLDYFKELYTTFIPIRATPHYMDIYLDVLRTAQPEYKGYSYEFESKFSHNGKILIHPFAIRKAKEWGLKKFIELARRLNENYDVCIIAPPNFIQEDILDELKLLKIDIQITNTIEELIEKTKEAGLFISNDSGPTYIASLLGKPTFIIYGPTNPKFSLPFGTNHQYFKMKLPCSAVEKKICVTLGGINCPSYECLNLISVDEIENAVADFIKKLGIVRKNKETESDLNNR